MAARDDFRRQVNDVWKQALDQLEEVKDALVDARGRVEADILKLRNERDKLLKRLGEQMYDLVNEGSVPVPRVVRRTVDRLNEVIDGLVKKSTSARKKGTKRKGKAKKRSSKKKTAKKKTKKKTATRKRARA